MISITQFIYLHGLMKYPYRKQFNLKVLKNGIVEI